MSPIEDKKPLDEILKKLEEYYKRLNLSESEMRIRMERFHVSNDDLLMNGYPINYPALSTEVFVLYSTNYETIEYARINLDQMLQNPQLFNNTSRKCTQCKRTLNWVNLIQKCYYHPEIFYLDYYTCCNSNANSMGCTVGSRHTYIDLSLNWNRPLGYKRPTHNPLNHQILGLDCEMIFTTRGHELARVTLVNIRGKRVLDEYVLPFGEVLNYVTEFSGIRPHHLRRAKDFNSVQNLVLEMVSDNTMLVGHSLQADLNALKIIHNNVIDTALLFREPQQDGDQNHQQSQKKSLKTLVKERLYIEIQKPEEGHNSWEDAAATLALIMRHMLDNRLGHPRDSPYNSHKIAPFPEELMEVLKRNNT